MAYNNNSPRPSKKRRGLKILLGTAILSSVLYFGNTFGMKDTIDNIAKEGTTAIETIIGTNYQTVEKKYSENLSKITTEEQIESLDSIISNTSDEVQQRITYETFQKQPEEYRGAFIEDAIKDLSSQYKFEIGTYILQGTYEEGKQKLGEFFDSLGTEIIELYDLFTGQ